MPTKLNKAAFQRLVDENLEWLRKQPRTLEREHIIEIVKWSVGALYPRSRDLGEHDTRFHLPPDAGRDAVLVKVYPEGVELCYTGYDGELFLTNGQVEALSAAKCHPERYISLLEDLIEDADESGIDQCQCSRFTDGRCCWVHRSYEALADWREKHLRGRLSRMTARGSNNTYFVSGHLNLSNEEFVTHYVPRLTPAIEQGANFVVGDAGGCDTKAMQFLAERVDPSRLKVFHMLTEPRNFVEGFPLVGGFESDEQRDAAMTKASTDDIAWVRPGKKGGRGTCNNIVRRFEVGWPHLAGRKALTRIFDTIDDLLLAGRFDPVERILKSLDVTRFEDTCLLGVLSITTMFREVLTERAGLAARIRSEYARRGMAPDKIDRLLKPHE
jgi:hypothetical protein